MASVSMLVPNSSFQLPYDFFLDWPLDLGQGDAFDFFGSGHGEFGLLDDGDWQAAAGSSGLTFSG